MYNVLFVCLGNICRSPLAKGLFSKILQDRKLEHLVYVDSCGTGGWHIGSPAHSETTQTAKKIGIDLSKHRARQLTIEDFARFDLIVPVDRSVQEHLLSVDKSAKFKIFLLRSFIPEDKEFDVPDPFYLCSDGFLLTQEIIRKGCQHLANFIESELLHKQKN